MCDDRPPAAVADWGSTAAARAPRRVSLAVARHGVKRGRTRLYLCRYRGGAFCAGERSREHADIAVV